MSCVFMSVREVNFICDIIFVSISVNISVNIVVDIVLEVLFWGVRISIVVLFWGRVFCMLFF